MQLNNSGSNFSTTPNVSKTVWGTSHTSGNPYTSSLNVSSSTNQYKLLIFGHLTGTSGAAVFPSFNAVNSSNSSLEVDNIFKGEVANQNGGVSYSFLRFYDINANSNYTINFTAQNAAHSYHGGNIIALTW